MAGPQVWPLSKCDRSDSQHDRKSHPRLGRGTINHHRVHIGIEAHDRAPAGATAEEPSLPPRFSACCGSSIRLPSSGYRLRNIGPREEAKLGSPTPQPPWSKVTSLLRGNDRVLDQHLWIDELGLNAGAARKVLTLGPRVPGFVHGIPQTDVGHPDGGGYHLRLVGAAKLQETIDFLENLLGCPLASCLRSAAVIPAVNTKPLAS